MVGAPLDVLNLNQQSGSSDFMGGYRPLDIALLARPLVTQWRDLFSALFSVDKNEHVLKNAEEHRIERRWPWLVQVWENSVETALKKLRKQLEEEEKATLEAEAAEAAAEEQGERAGEGLGGKRKKKKKGKKKKPRKKSAINVQIEQVGPDVRSYAV